MPGIRCGASRAIAVAIAMAAPLLARAAALPPEPELRVPLTASEAEVEALAPGDPRRARALVELAVRRHADAREALEQEQVANALAVAQWRDADRNGASDARPERPVGATPRTDALRAQAVELAQRALEEAPGYPDLPDALIVGGVDASRIGRAREALRMLGALIRRFPGSTHVADAWIAMGEHHLRNADLTRARIAFDEAERKGRPAVRAWAAARNAEASLAVNDLQGALAAIERAMAVGFGRAQPLLERVAAAVDRQRPADRRSGSPDVETRLADLLERAGEPARAAQVRASARARTVKR